MRVVLITGAQGVGKNRKAYELVGLGKEFIEFDAVDFTNKSSWQGIENSPVVIIDNIHSSKQIGQIQNLIQRGSTRYRITYAKEVEDYKIEKLILISCADLSLNFPEAKHIELTHQV